MFAGQRPIFKEVDEVTFMRPVDVGDLLKFRSCVVHTTPSSSSPDKVCIPVARHVRHLINFSTLQGKSKLHVVHRADAVDLQLQSVLEKCNKCLLLLQCWHLHLSIA